MTKVFTFPWFSITNLLKSETLYHAKKQKSPQDNVRTEYWLNLKKWTTTTEQRPLWNMKFTTRLLKMPKEPIDPYPLGIQAQLKLACVATNPIWQYQIWFLLAESITGHQSRWFKRVLIEITDASAQLKRSKS